MRPSILSPTRQLSSILSHPKPHHLRPKLPSSHHTSRTNRPFINSSLRPPPQSLNATRTLSFPASSLYTIIADIDAYSTFLPFLSSSKVTHWSNPDENHQKTWPQRAELRVGYAGYEETFQSNVYCVPGKIVEAVAGQAQTTIDKAQLEHYQHANTNENPPENRIFHSLLTRWNLHTFPYKPPPSSPSSSSSSSSSSPPSQHLQNAHQATEQTEVRLVIEYQFASPVYAALSQAFAPKIAGLMIEAFEKRAVDVLGEGGDGPGISGFAHQATEQKEVRLMALNQPFVAIAGLEIEGFEKQAVDVFKVGGDELGVPGAGKSTLRSSGWEEYGSAP